jgi:hypothetical protein
VHAGLRYNVTIDCPAAGCISVHVVLKTGRKLTITIG